LSAAFQQARCWKLRPTLHFHESGHPITDHFPRIRRNGYTWCAFATKFRITAAGIATFVVIHGAHPVAPKILILVIDSIIMNGWFYPGLSIL
jgi:hypothetical protein